MLDSSLVSKLLQQLIDSNGSLKAVALLDEAGAVLARSFRDASTSSSSVDELSLALSSLVANFTWGKVKADSQWIGVSIQNHQMVLSPINGSYSIVVVSSMETKLEDLSKVALEGSALLAQNLAD